MLAQLVVSGIAQGALYALVALAMTVVYRATTVINFGQGDFVMAGAFSLAGSQRPDARPPSLLVEGSCGCRLALPPEAPIPRVPTRPPGRRQP